MKRTVSMYKGWGTECYGRVRLYDGYGMALRSLGEYTGEKLISCHGGCLKTD